MMTEREQLEAMLKRAGVEYTTEELTGSACTHVLLIVPGGYTGFYTQFVFDAHTGELQGLGAYE